MPSSTWKTVATEEVQLMTRQTEEESVVEPTTETVHHLPVETWEASETSATTEVVDRTAVQINITHKG